MRIIHIRAKWDGQISLIICMVRWEVGVEEALVHTGLCPPGNGDQESLIHIVRRSLVGQVNIVARCQMWLQMQMRAMQILLSPMQCTVLCVLFLAGSE